MLTALTDFYSVLHLHLRVGTDNPRNSDRLRHRCLRVREPDRSHGIPQHLVQRHAHVRRDFRGGSRLLLVAHLGSRAFEGATMHHCLCTAVHLVCVPMG